MRPGCELNNSLLKTLPLCVDDWQMWRCSACNYSINYSIYAHRHLHKVMAFKTSNKKNERSKLRSELSAVKISRPNPTWLEGRPNPRTTLVATAKHWCIIIAFCYDCFICIAFIFERFAWRRNRPTVTKIDHVTLRASSRARVCQSTALAGARWQSIGTPSTASTASCASDAGGL